VSPGGAQAGAAPSALARVSAGLGRAALVLIVATTVAAVLAFLALPVVALLVHQPPAQVLDELGSPVASDAIAVSLRANAVAMAVMLLLGTPVAYLLGRHRFPGRSLVITLVELPLVLPPAVAGIGLLAAFGRLGLLGHTLQTAGIHLAFTQAAVVIAIVFVASPFYLRGAIAAFEAIEPTMLDVAGTLGAGPLRRMLRVALPLAGAGLGAAAAVSFARGIGEFGATIFFAGSFQGTTQTLPLAVYSQFEVSLDQAIAIGVLLVVVSAAILITSKLLIRSWTFSISTSLLRGARSRFARRSA
jgi:molybdate transport system permease protein